MDCHKQLLSPAQIFCLETKNLCPHIKRNPVGHKKQPAEMLTASETGKIVEKRPEKIGNRWKRVK